MSKKIVTKEDINRRLSALGKDAKVVGLYQKQQAKSTFECSKGHTWVTTADNVLRRSGCPTCADSTITKDEFIKKLSSRKNITMIGEYVSYNTPTEFQCENGHIWSTRPVFINGRTRGNGCSICQTDRKRLTKEIVDRRLLAQGKGIRMTGDYVDAITKTLFKCKNNHEWQSAPDTVMSGKGCRLCAKSGFKINKPASAYILLFDGFIKFGITNNLSERLKTHKGNGPYTICKTIHYNTGKEALEWENSIKQIYGGKYATKEQCPDGWTETLPVSLLEEVSRRR
jgi:predicted GIY-YIG superfamily endonuclease